MVGTLGFLVAIVEVVGRDIGFIVATVEVVGTALYKIANELGLQWR